MKSQITTIALLGAALVPAALLLGCETAKDVTCPLFHCSFEGDEGVRVSIASAIDRFAGNVPVTITVCAEKRCAEVVLRLAGKDFVCISDDIRAECSVTDEGAVEIEYAVGLPEKEEVSVRLTVQDAAGEAVFDEARTAKIEDTRPSDMDCPQVCRETQVTFTPPAASP